MNQHQNPQFSFRPVDIETDVHILYEWLADPEVNTWYNEGDHSIENYREVFAPDPTTHKFIMCVDSVPVGYVQAYRLADEPDYARQVGLDPDYVSLDILIGPSDYRGKGYGGMLLREVLDHIVFGELAAERACINPNPENTRAVRSYEKVGFRGDRVVWIEGDEPHNTGNERIMLLTRQDFYDSKG